VVCNRSSGFETNQGSRRLEATARLHDVVASIPSECVQKRRYERMGAMVYYGFPSRWATGIADAICGTVRELIGSTEKVNLAP
jgi:hypothetical protein